jgi:hypothetical protein
MKMMCLINPIPYDPNDRWDHAFYTIRVLEEIRLAMGKDNKIPNASAAVLLRKPTGIS